MTGGHVVLRIFGHLKISDTDGTVLGLSDLVQVELRNGNVQAFVKKLD